MSIPFHPFFPVRVHSIQHSGRLARPKDKTKEFPCFSDRHYSGCVQGQDNFIFAIIVLYCTCETCTVRTVHANRHTSIELRLRSCMHAAGMEIIRFPLVCLPACLPARPLAHFAYSPHAILATIY